MAMGPLYLIPLHESAVGVQPFGKKKGKYQGGCIVFCDNYIVLDIDAVNLSYADLWSHTIDDVYICGNDV